MILTASMKRVQRSRRPRFRDPADRASTCTVQAKNKAQPGTEVSARLERLSGSDSLYHPRRYQGPIRGTLMSRREFSSARLISSIALDTASIQSSR